MPMKNKVNLLLGLAVGALFIWLALRGTDIEGVKASFKAANYRYLIPVVLLSVLVQIVRSYRWGVIVEPLEKIDQRTLFYITSVGFMAITLLPVRMGEFVRPYLISRKSTVKLGSSVATIVVERIFDLLTLMILLLFVLTTVDLPEWVLKTAYSILLIIIPVLFLLIFLAVKREISAKGIDRILVKLPHTISVRLMKLFHSFLDGLQILPDWKKTVYLSSLSLAIWCLIGLVTYILFASFASMSQLPLAAAYAVLIITALGVALPTAPGFIGNYHFSCVLGLTLFSIPKTDALTFAIVLHFIQLSVVIVLGLVCLPFIKVPLSSLFKGDGQINTQYDT